MSESDRRAFTQGMAAATLMSVIGPSFAQAATPGFFVIAEIVAKPEKANDLRALLEPFAIKSRTEPGCQLYALLEVQNEPGRFLTYEKWTDKAALEAHMVTPHIKEIVPKLGDLLAKPFTQIFMNGVSGV